MAATLVTSHLDDLQLTVECVYLGHNIEYACIRLVVAGELGDQPPVVRAMGQIHGLMVERRLPQNGIDEPHGEWLSRGVMNV